MRTIQKDMTRGRDPARMAVFQCSLREEAEKGYPAKTQSLLMNLAAIAASLRDAPHHRVVGVCSRMHGHYFGKMWRIVSSTSSECPELAGRDLCRAVVIPEAGICPFVKDCRENSDITSPSDIRAVV